MLTFYGYPKCSTCVKAKKTLAALKPNFEDIAVTLSPPSAKELTEMIKNSGRPLADFLNRSGIQYRLLNMREKVKKYPEDKIIKLLAMEGRLIKRPIVTDGKKVTVGYKEEEFKGVWKK